MKQKVDKLSAEKLLIIVDMVNGFINFGALSDGGIAKIIPENVRLAEKFLKEGGPVVAFRDCHTADSPELDSFPAHCMRGTEEAELVNELKALQEKFIVIDKDSTSGFFAPGFADIVGKMRNLKEVVITGCCTDICVLNLAVPMKNFFNQLQKKVNIVVPKNAVETYNISAVHERTEWNNMAFRFMEQAGVKVVQSY